MRKTSFWMKVPCIWISFFLTDLEDKMPYFWVIFRNHDHSASRVGRWEFSFWQKKGWKWICRNYGQAVPKSWKNICILQWSRKSKKTKRKEYILCCTEYAEEFTCTHRCKIISKANIKWPFYQLKFIYSEKATKFWEIFPLL